MSLLMAFLVLALFSFLAFWKLTPVLFMLTAGTSLILGFYWYDTYVSNLGLTIGLMLVGYAIYCLALALRTIFWSETETEDED